MGKKITTKPGESTSSLSAVYSLISSWLQQPHLTAGAFTRFNKIVPTCLLALSSLIIPALFTTTSTNAADSTLSITISGSPKVSISPTPEGKFADSGDSTITVTTTHAAGYTLSAKATNSTSLNGNSTSGSLSSISEAVSPTNYADANYASSHNLNNTWGYKPSTFCNTTTGTTDANTNYLPSPGLGTEQSPADILAITDNSNNGTYNVSIGARVTTDTAIDKYTNTFVFFVLPNPTPYVINYNQNTTDTVTNMPTNHTATDPGAAGGSAVIANNVPERDGYIFQGWCTAALADGATCASPNTLYQPDSLWTLSQTDGIAVNTLNLYAVWKVDNPCAGLTALYDLVSCQSKGKQTLAQLQATITVPTSAKRSTDTSNSGVYEYDPDVFGISSDASNDNKIYYYRGVLENSPGSYGSDGSAVTYPNYVILQAGSTKATTDTCWRIVRTTGSGGIKMIYNGKWTGSTCANATTAAQVTTQAFAEKGTSAQSTYWYRNIHYVGYTFNNNVTDSTTDTPVDTVFGSNSNYSTTNTTSSAMKKYIENNWFSTISSYESILEPSAGYCNDRTAYSDNTTATALITITPYKTSSATMYFGAYGRNINAANAGKAPSLTCSSSRNVVDLYTTSSASNGNKQLSKPAALLTADEVSLAGSGRSPASQGSAYHTNSFLRSGSNFWLLSPLDRGSNGNALEFYLNSGGLLNSGNGSNAYGVRPAISLTSGTTATSGTGIATDPWVVTAP